MIDYFDSPVAYNPDSDDLVTGATFQVFAPDDSSFATPLAVTDPASGANITVLSSSNIGVLPAFRVAGDLPQVVLKSGAFTTLLSSRFGALIEAGFDPDAIAAAVAAVAGAEAARDDAVAAQAAVADVIATNDGIMAAVAATPGSAFATAQEAAFLAVGSDLFRRRFAGDDALAERAAVTGEVPPRMTTPPTVVFSKGQGLSNALFGGSGGSGYAVGDEITLAGGTALVPAIVKVATLSGSAVATVTLVRRGIYTSTPSNPVAQASTTGAGTGANFSASWSGAEMGTCLVQSVVGPTDARIRFTGNGPANLSSSGYYGNSAGNGTHCSFEWATNSQRVDVRLIGLNSNLVLYVDGKQVSASAVTTDASGSSYIYALDFGSVAWRDFKLIGFNNAFGGIRVDSTATVSAPLAAEKPLGWSLGDSYTAGSGVENAGSGHISVMADVIGIDVLPDGIGGTGWTSASGNAPAARITTKLGGLTRVPDYVFFDLGYNDAGGNMTTAAAAFDAAVAAAEAEAPDARIICFGPATPLGTSTNLDAVRAMLIARCAFHGIPFVDARDWVNATNKVRYTGGDNIHPSATGHKFLGARRAVAVAPYL